MPGGVFAEYDENIQGGSHDGVIKDPLVFMCVGCV